VRIYGQGRRSASVGDWRARQADRFARELCDTAVGAGYRDSRLQPKGFGQLKRLCDAVDAPAFWTVWTE